MKRRIIFIITILFAVACLTSCGKKQVAMDGQHSISGDGSRDLNDDQYYLGTSIQRTIAEGPDAFYFVSAEFLYYMDKNTHEVGILCPKADCKHYEETDYEKSWACGAHILSPQSVVYYNGKLYICSLETNSIGTFDVVVNQYSLLGEFEKKVAVLPESTDSIIQHQGTAYYVYYDLDEDTEDDDWGEVHFMSLDLSSGAQEQLASWPGTEVYTAGDAFVFKDCLYLKMGYFEDPHEFTFHVGYDMFDLKTGEHSSYRDEEYGLTTLFPYKDGLIYSKYEEYEGEKTENAKEILYQSGLRFENEKAAAELTYEDGQTAVFDDVVLVSNRWAAGRINGKNPEMITIYKNLKPVGEFNMYDIPWTDSDDSMGNVARRFSDIGDYILVTVWSEKSHDNNAMIALEKEKLTKGIADPIVLFEPKLAACYGYGSA